MHIQKIETSARHYWQPKIAALEALASYPLGSDRFQIDHGDDYFTFFDRLGQLEYYVGTDAQLQVLAVGAGVYRSVAWQFDQTKRDTWYLCDLKVHPNYCGRYGSMKLLHHAILAGLQTRACRSAYLISMNPAEGKNQLVRVLEQNQLLPFRHAATLNIYSLDTTPSIPILSCLERHRGPVQFESLQGIKDLRLVSSGLPLQVRHARWGSVDHIVKNTGALTFNDISSTYMFCATSTDGLAIELGNLGLKPTATASIVACNMGDCDWQFVLTGEI
jgi:hypothetical protein